MHILLVMAARAFDSQYNVARFVIVIGQSERGRDFRFSDRAKERIFHLRVNTVLYLIKRSRFEEGLLV
jgi:hypothetical protein